MGIPAGIYNLSAKASNFLSQNQVLIEVADDQTASGVNFSLLGGDAYDDNYVNYKDRNILMKAYGTTPANPRWDPRADFVNDNIIDYKDRNILMKNFGLIGAQ